ncbi:MAG: transporter substrate-binding domain-containing protein [Eubacteriales bacterium]
MKKFIRILTLALIATLCIGAFAGCGKTPTVDTIRKEGKIVMLTNAAFPPFEYVDGSDIVGVDVDIAREIAADLGVELEIQNMEFDGIVGAVQSGKGAIGVAGMSINEERLQSVDFSVEYVKSKLVVLVSSDNTEITTPDALTGKSIAVQTGTTSDVFASDIKDATISRYKSFLDAASALNSGKVDAVIVDEMTAAEILSANAILVQLADPLTEERYAIAIQKGNKTLLDAVNTTLNRLISEGKIDEYIYNHTAAGTEAEG